MLLENVEKYMIWLFFYSVVGWIYESTLCSVRAHKFINRGFLNGPYCPIYGWGAVLDILILGKVQNPVLLFFLGAIVTCFSPVIRIPHIVFISHSQTAPLE